MPLLQPMYPMGGIASKESVNSMHHRWPTLIGASSWVHCPVAAEAHEKNTANAHSCFMGSFQITDDRIADVMEYGRPGAQILQMELDGPMRRMGKRTAKLRDRAALRDGGRRWSGKMRP